MESLRLKKSIQYLVFIVLSLLIYFLSRDNFFFWDTISQVSIPANWYYDNDFKYLFVPDDLTTGHPPSAGLYLAMVWKVFGRSLPVSHLAFLPFIFGIFVQLYRLIEKSGEKEIIIWLIMGVTVIDPTL
jgi:hypothetical protein